MSEKLSQTADMLQRIHSLEEQNKLIPGLQQQLQTLQQGIVNTCATQIQHLFTNPVMVDSIAHAVLLAAANAIAFKARASQDRAPELVVVEGYIPGALRAILSEDGSIDVSQQLKGALNAGSAWESANADFEEKGILAQFADLLVAYGANTGRVYYITDTVTQQAFREKLAKDLASGVGAAFNEEPSAEEAADGTVELAEGNVRVVLLEEGADDTYFVDMPLYLDVTTVRNGEPFIVDARDLQVGDTLVSETKPLAQVTALLRNIEPDAVAEVQPTEYLVHVEEPGELDNGLIIPSTANLIVTRGFVEAEISPVSLMVGDVFTYVASLEKTYRGTVKSVEEMAADATTVEPSGEPATDLPLAEPAPLGDEVEPDAATTGTETEAPADEPVDGGIKVAKSQVELHCSAMPLSAGLDHDAVDAVALPRVLVDLDQEYDVIVAGQGTVRKQAQDLARGDVIQVARNGQVSRESVLDVRSVAAEAEAAVA